MTEYVDIRCGDDVDPFGRDAAPLEVLAQDLYHLLITSKFCMLRAEDVGLDLESYLGQPIPSTLASEIASAVREDDRVSDARCTITPVPGEVDSYRLELVVEVESTFLTIALALTPSGIVRVS